MSTRNQQHSTTTQSAPLPAKSGIGTYREGEDKACGHARLYPATAHSGSDGAAIDQHEQNRVESLADR